MAVERIDLETFLAGLPDLAAAEARVAAAHIDELDRAALAVEGIERRYAPWALGAGILFVIALVTVFSGAEIFNAVRRAIGVVALAGMAAALPILALTYSIHVRKRTRADARKLALNRHHFLPHGGIYFPPGETEGGVYLTGPPKAADQRSRKDRIRPGPIW